MAKKAIVELIFVLIICIVILIMAYTFLAQFFEATPELGALRDVRDAIETVCAPDGPMYQQTAIFLPADSNKIVLKSTGIIELQTKDSTVQKRLSCDTAIIFADCTLGTTSEGKESITFGVKKNIDPATQEITVELNDSASSGLVTC